MMKVKVVTRELNTPTHSEQVTFLLSIRMIFKGKKTGFAYCSV